MIALGFDGGVDTGFGVWGPKGVEVGLQGSPAEVLYQAAQVVKARRHEIGIIGVERAFIARDPAKIGGSVRSVENESFIRGVLWALGIPEGLVWRCEASEWRALVGIPQRAPLPNGKSRRCTSDEMKHHAVKRYAMHAGLGSVPENRSHVAEAICIAEAGYRRAMGRKMAREMIGGAT